MIEANRRGCDVWAQLISVRIKDGAEDDIVRIMEMLRGIEQPGSGIIRHLVFRDDANPLLIRTLAVFESEEMARAREADPRRHLVQASAQAIMANAIDGPPSFNDLDVIWEHTY
jgi:hypothetical protein